MNANDTAEQIERVKNTIATDGWQKDIFPWIEREMRAAAARVRGAMNKPKDEIEREYVAGQSVLNHIQNLIQELNRMSGTKIVPAAKPE